MFYVSWDKLRWASEVVSSHHMILGRGRTFWVPYAGYYVLRHRYHALGSKAQVYVHSEDAPRWIKKATQGYYTLVRYPYSESAPRWVRSAADRYYALRGKYGYGWLRYRLELARARRQIRRSNTSHKH
jgi:hypothetical protein